MRGDVWVRGAAHTEATGAEAQSGVSASPPAWRASPWFRAGRGRRVRPCSVGSEPGPPVPMPSCASVAPPLVQTSNLFVFKKRSIEVICNFQKLFIMITFPHRQWIVRFFRIKTYP